MYLEDIDECGGDYAPFRPDMYCGGISYRSVLGLDIHQVNVASVEGAEVSGDEHFVVLLGLLMIRDGFSGAWPSVGLA